MFDRFGVVYEMFEKMKMVDVVVDIVYSFVFVVVMLSVWENFFLCELSVKMVRVSVLRVILIDRLMMSFVIGILYCIMIFGLKMIFGFVLLLKVKVVNRVMNVMRVRIVGLVIFMMCCI